MNASTFFSSAFSLDGLISVDAKKLTSVLDFIVTRLKTHETLVQEMVKSGNNLESTVDVLADRLNRFEETSDAFSRSVEDMNKMNDKVAAWSERFRSMEEQHYSLRATMQAESDRLDEKMKEMNKTHTEAVANVMANVKSLLEVRDIRLGEKLTAVKSQQEDLALDLKFAMEKLEKTTMTRLTDMMGVLELSPEGNTASDTAAAQSQTLRSVMVRVKALEAKVNELMDPMDSGALAALGLDVDVIHTEIGKDQLILELQNKLLIIVNVIVRQQASQFTQKLEQIRTGDTTVVSAIPSDSAPQPRITSLHQRLEDLEQQLSAELRKRKSGEDEIEHLAARVDALQTRWKEEKGGRQLVRASFTRMDSMEITEADLAVPKMASTIHAIPGIERHSPLTSEDLREEVLLLRSGFDQFSEELEKLRKQLKDRVSHLEAEDIAVAIVKRAGKAIPVKSGAAGEGEGKTGEIETRLNNYWKLFQDIQTQVHGLKESTADIDSRLQQMIHEKCAEVQDAATSSHQSLRKRIDSLQESIDHLAADKLTEELLENEQYLRSIVLKLKNDVQKLQSEMEATQQKESQPLIQELNFDDITDDMEAKKLRIILQQHDQAIRYLATRFTAQVPEDSSILGRSQDNSATLMHMEQLRSEMKEMLSKHESTSSLSSKDLDLVKEIYTTLDTKIGKEELIAKVDRSELLKIYRQLKRKTDALAEAVKRSETAGAPPTREDVILTRKRLDAECASCGQLLPETADLQNHSFQPWGRFPHRSNLFGPGFSHVLSSLVSSPSGSISLAKREETTDDRSTVHSPRLSRVKRRGVIKLPSVK